MFFFDFGWKISTLRSHICHPMPVKPSDVMTTDHFTENSGGQGLCGPDTDTALNQVVTPCKWTYMIWIWSQLPVAKWLWIVLQPLMLIYLDYLCIVTKLRGINDELWVILHHWLKVAPVLKWENNDTDKANQLLIKAICLLNLLKTLRSWRKKWPKEVHGGWEVGRIWQT